MSLQSTHQTLHYTDLLSNQVFEGQTKNLFLAVKPFFSVKLG